MMEEQRLRTNVNDLERVVCLVAGGAILFRGLQRRRLRGAACVLGGASLLSRGVTGHSRLYERLGIDSTAEGSARGIQVSEAVTVMRPAEEVYQALRHPEGHGRAWTNALRLTRHGDGSYRATWDLGKGCYVHRVALVSEQPGTYVSWRSLPGEPVVSEGEVSLRPAPGDRGTEVRVHLRYAPARVPSLILALHLARRVLRTQLILGLARLKQQLEAGEIATNAMRPATRALDVAAHERIEPAHASKLGAREVEA